MLGLDIPLSSIGAIQQPLSSTDLLLITQDTPDGFKSYRGSLAQLMEWIFVGSGTVDDYIPHDYLDMVRTLNPNSGLLGNGKITDPMSLDFDYLSTLFIGTTVFNDYQNATDLELANQAMLIDELGTYVENNFVKNTVFNNHVAAEEIARNDGDTASRAYADSLDLARAIDTINRINVEAYVREQADIAEANARYAQDVIINGDLANIYSKIGTVGGTSLQAQIDAISVSASGAITPNYAILPGGLIIQWLSATESGSWPIAFPNGCFKAVISFENVAWASTNTHVGVIGNSSGFTLTRGADNGGLCGIIAIGY